ncbi:MAG: transcription antitermination factor NusB [Clostridiales bacterium]|nr:transcription antitermination factor NusB [Clostridiales bacterium]
MHLGGKVKRREYREHTFCLLFRNDFFEKGEMKDQIDLYLEGINNITEIDKTELITRINTILSELLVLDEKIEVVAEGWNLSRMGKVELTIIRLALFEILFDDDIPTNVAINEAVELSKKYGQDESSSFVNGILAKLI